MSKKNPIVLLSFYLIISIIFVSFNLNPTIKAMRDFLFYMVVTPFSKVNYAATSIGNLGANIEDIINVRQEASELRSQNQELLHNLVKLKTLEIENKRLSELLGYKRNIGRKTVIARIIAKPPQQYYKSMIIDKGSADGLSENRAVFSFYKGKFGLIGQLINIDKDVSQVLTITDRISRVPARIVPADVDGIIVGLESNELEMIWIPSEADVKIGDQVVTSSASDIFPAGIPIGIVVSVTQTGYLPFKKALVKPTIPAFQLTDVFIE